MLLVWNIAAAQDPATRRHRRCGRQAQRSNAHGTPALSATLLKLTAQTPKAWLAAPRPVTGHLRNRARPQRWARTRLAQYSLTSKAKFFAKRHLEESFEGTGTELLNRLQYR